MKRAQRIGGLLGFVLTGSAALAQSADGTPAPRDPVRGRTLFREAMAAREANDLAGYRAKLEKAARGLPDPSNLWFRLAGARLLVGDRTAAFEALEAQLAAGMHRPDFESNPDLAPLHEHLRWKPLAEANTRLVAPVVRSEEAFRLSDGGMLVEGIAVDPASGAQFLSVVNRRQILRRAADGSVALFAQLAGKLPGSPLGLAVDGPRGRLWVATAGLPHGEALPADEKDRGALAAFDLASGELVETIRLDGEGHLPNDLVLGASGTVYVSDPGAAAIWRRTEAGKLEKLALGGSIVSPGGLALSADERLLWVADWSYGLATVDLATLELSWAAPPAGGTLLGIDGLVRDGNALVAIQNGVAPPRISRLELAPGGRAIASATLLERALPEWDEPTIGTIVGGALLYVSNSHWPRFGEEGKPADPAALTPAAIRRLPLDALRERSNAP